MSKLVRVEIRTQISAVIPMKRWMPSFLFLLLFASWQTAEGQIVQIPTAGSFELSSSLSVPDSGTASLGSLSSARAGSARQAGGAVHATVIDLAELDSMIRSQSGKISVQPAVQPKDPLATGRKRASPKGRIDHAEYDYLLALSRGVEIDHRGDSDAVDYYLAMAERARSRGSWSSVELYYSMAWRNLSPERRESALLALEKARAAGKNKDGDMQNSHPRD